MISSGTPPDVVATILTLANSVHPHHISAAALYREALSAALTAYDQADSDSTEQLEMIMESVSKHESTGCVNSYILSTGKAVMLVLGIES